MMEINTVYNENCLDTMRRMRDNFIDMILAGPPYDNMREYDGYDFDFKPIAKELFRTIKDGGVLVWIVGDQTVNGSETGTSFQQALYFKEIGFKLHDTMIYEKKGGSLSRGKRYVPAFEYMFVLSKGTPLTFNPLIDKPNKHAGRTSWSASKVRGEDGSLTTKKPTVYADYGKRTNIWSYARGYQLSTCDTIAFQHPAIFPEKLVGDHILSWSNPKDLVYDPFMGSGTTAKMALLNNRNYIGSEVSSKYCSLIEERLSNLVQHQLRKEMPNPKEDKIDFDGFLSIIESD